MKSVRQRDDRPGAMTLAMRAFGSLEPTVLRVARVEGNLIVDEATIEASTSVHAGRDPSCRFVLDAGSEFERFPVFEHSGGRYFLNFTASMVGTLSQQDRVIGLDELQAGASRTERGFRVPLETGARGRVEIDGTIIVFQFVTPRVKPPLPVATQGALSRSIDWVFTAFVLMSYMSFFGFVVYLENTDWAYSPPSSEIPDLMARYVFNEPQAPPEPPEHTDTSEPEVETAEVTDVPVDDVEVVEAPRSDRRSRSTDRRAPVEIDQAVLQNQVRQAMNLSIGAERSSSGGLAQFLEGPVTDSRELLATAGRVTQVSAMTPNERNGGPGGSGEARRIGDIASGMGGGMQIATGQVGERAVRPVVSQRAIDPIDGTGVFDPRQVVRGIRARSSRFRHCYERELSANPGLEGRISVRFTIQPRGNITSIQVSGNSTGSDSLASCVTRTLQSIRYTPGPEGGSVTFAYPFMFALQQ